MIASFISHSHVVPKHEQQWLIHATFLVPLAVLNKTSRFKGLGNLTSKENNHNEWPVIANLY
jgi:hypothetical protein